jgi:hypothetical protein
MTLLDQRIEDIVVGDDVDVERVVTNVPSGQELSKAWLTIKTAEADLDAAAVIQKAITSTPQAGVGQITDTGSGDTIGTIVFSLTAADTLLLGSTIVYYYDIQVKTDQAKVYTVEKGLLQLKKQITISSS